jgi:hypothetical protein
MTDIPAETKSHQKLRSRIQYLLLHMQTVDAALHVMRSAIPDPSEKKVTLVNALGFDKDKYCELNHPVDEKDRIINHTRARNSEYAIITLYRYFIEYLRNVLREIYIYKPLVVVGKAPPEYCLSYVEIVKLGSFDAISEKMVTDVFRHLEEKRNTKKFIKNMLAGIITVDEATKTNALKYLDMRHLFIHASGIVDQEYINKYGKELSLHVGENLPTTYDNARAAIEAVTLLCQVIDQELIAHGYVEPRELERSKAG